MKVCPETHGWRVSMYLCIYVCMYLCIYTCMFCSNVGICGHVVPSTNLTNPVQPWEPNRSLHTSAGNGTNCTDVAENHLTKLIPDGPTFSKGPYIKRRLLIVDSWFVSITRWISIGWSSAWNTWLKQANIYHLCNFQLTWAPRSLLLWGPSVVWNPWTQRSIPILFQPHMEVAKHPSKSLFALHYAPGIIHHILHTILRSIKTWSPILGKGPLPIQLGGVDIQNCGTYPRLDKYPASH